MAPGTTLNFVGSHISRPKYFWYSNFGKDISKYAELLQSEGFL